MTQPGKIVELDVRPHLRKKLEPFKLIMDTVKELHPEDTFVLHATFKPTPLLALMKTKGYVNQVKKISKDHWVTTFLHKSRKHELKGEMDVLATSEWLDSPETKTKAEDGEQRIYELDNRGLQPPQPMVRTLNTLEKANVGDQVIIHNDRIPMFLIEELNQLGYLFEVEEFHDGTAKVTITKQ